MSNDTEPPKISEYVTVKEAAQLLGLADRTVYEFVEEDRLAHKRVADVILIPLEAVQAFKRGISGKLRKNIPLWRISAGENEQFMTLIFIKIRDGCRDKLLKKLEEIRRGKRHLFPGTVLRSLMESETDEGLVTIVLVWRGLIMPPEREREEALTALRTELADVLDWETAQYNNGHVLMHT